MPLYLRVGLSEVDCELMTVVDESPADCFGTVRQQRFEKLQAKPTGLLPTQAYADVLLSGSFAGFTLFMLLKLLVDLPPIGALRIDQHLSADAN